jgi:hypothetical protein
VGSITSGFFHAREICKMNAVEVVPEGGPGLKRGKKRLAALRGAIMVSQELKSTTNKLKEALADPTAVQATVKSEAVYAVKGVWHDVKAVRSELVRLRQTPES